MSIETEKKNKYQITKKDIAGLKKLLKQLRSFYRSSKVSMDNTDVNLGKISARTQTAVYYLSRNEKLVALDIFCEKDMSLDDVKDKWGKAFEATINSLSADLNLKKDEVTILVEVHKEALVQFGPHRRGPHLSVQLWSSVT